MLIKEQLLTSGQYNVQKTSNKLFVWGLGTSGQVSSVLYLFSLAQLSAGNSHTVALTSDNRLLAWGLNSSGQIGDGTTINKSFPQQVGQRGGWKRVSAGGSFTVAIRGDGTLYTWGLNDSGQLGIGLTTNRSSPTQAGIGVNWNNIDAGENHVLATTTTALLYTWGLNNAGQMGEGNTINRSSPAQIFAITDTSSNSNLITKVNSNYSTTIVPITGSMSGYFDGSSLVTAPDSSIFEMGAGNFTVEAFFYATALNSFNTLIHKGAAGVFAPYYIAVNSSGNLIFWSSSTGSNWDIANALNFGTIIINTWYHVAISRTSSDLFLFVNGVLQTTLNVGVLSLTDNNRAVAIGCRTDGTEGFTGYISNVRIVKGVGVYTGAFTVPTTVLTTTQSAGTNISAITGNETSLLLYTTFNNTIVQTSFSQVSAGSSYSAAINTTYKLYTWGLNASGQLGQVTLTAPSGDQINRSSPTQVGTSSWQLVSAGQGHTAAINNSSVLFTWGLNSSFQLGNNSTISRSSPIQVTTGSGSGSWKNVSAGNAFTLAIANDPAGSTDNLLFSWGRNQEGQTGFNGTTTLRSTPQQITTGSWSLISAGSSFSVATNDSKLLYNWGSGSGGTQADGITINRSSPVLVLFTQTITQSSPIQIGVDSWSVISGGGNFFIGLRSDYKLYGWGLNSSGQLGDNTTINKSSPVQIGTSSWTAVAAGFGSTVFAIRSDTTLWTWGVSYLANQSGGNVITTSWKQITANANSSLALRSDDTLWFWGEGQFGQSGQGNTINRSNPIQINHPNAPSKTWKKIGENNTTNNAIAAIDSDDKLYMWGRNAQGQLADGTTVDKSTPTAVMADKNWYMISGSKGITTDYKLWSWGPNTLGELGDNTTIDKSSPVQITAESGTVVSFILVTGASTTAAHNFALSIENKLYGWGQNNTGQLGNNTTTNRSAPTILVAPFDTYSWSMVSVGNMDGVGTQGGHTLAIRSNGTLYAWGINASGQLGISSTQNKSSPVLVTSDYTDVPTSWAAIAASNSRSLAVDVDGYPYGWGYAAVNGAVGDNTTVNKSKPVIISTFTWSKIASGFFHSNAITEDGFMFGWGANNVGNIGNNTTVARSAPVAIQTLAANVSSPVQVSSGLSNFTQITSKTSAHAAITSSGSLYIWGINNVGQLGTGTTLNRNVPRLLDNNSWTKISMGIDHTLGIRSNSMYAWGGNAGYQLGIDVTANRSSPVQIGTSYAEVTISSWLQVSAGNSFSLAIDSNYKLYGWGLNNAGQLGIVTESFSWTQIDAGQLFAGAIRQDGTLWFWGTNLNGNLGTILGRSSPTQIGTSSWTQVSVTKNLTNAAAAIRSDGALFMWGNNSAGQLGDITTITKSSPVQIGSSSWSQVSVGDSHTLAIDATGRLFGWGLATALNSSTAPFSWTMVSENTSSVVAVRSDGLLFTWGLNSSGQLGDNTTITKSSPTQIGASSWTTASAGTNHVLAITSDYRLFAWGGNAANQLGDNSTVSKSSPVQVVNPSVSWTSVSAANSFSMGITSTNSLYVWGLGTSGQLGTLTEILSWNTLSAGSSNSLAVRNNGRLYGWGLNTGYQLGDGSSITKSSPVQVAGTLSYSQVSAGVNHTLAITNTGALYGWGVATTGATGNYGEVYSWNMVANSADNSFFIRSDGSLWVTGPNTNGILGLNDTVTRSSPVQVGTSSWTFISAKSVVLGITADYKLFSWGENSGGQSGDGTTISKSSPVQIGIGFSWIQVAAGGNYSLAIRSDNTLWSFGYNFQGQLGFNDIINRSNPTQVGTSSWIAVAAGGASMAIRSDNTLWTWGLNNFGQLGINVNTDRSSPVQVTTPGTGPWLAIAANNDYNLAVSGAGLGTPYSVYFIGGLNLQGQAGLNSTSSSLSLPTLTRAGAAGSSYIQVCTNGTASQFYSNQALTSDGKIWAWGYNGTGQLGDGTSLAGAKSSPVLVSGSTSWSQLPKQNAESSSFGIRNDGTLYGWGYAAYYVTYNAAPIQVSNPIQIGGNIRWANYNSPIYAINSEAGQGSWTSVAAGNSFSLGIKNNKLYTWGQNNLGQTGNNNTAINPILSPTQLGTSDWSIVSASELNNFAAAIASDGKLFMWGVNTSGQLGLTNINANGDTVNRSSPVQVGTSSWASVSAGASHTLAIRSDNTLWSWGTNTNRQLGDGLTISRSSPIQIGTSSWSVVSAGFDHSMAIRIDGTLWAWGSNTLGQMGLATAAFSWIQVANTGLTTHAIRSDGLLFGWGLNTSGEIGDNSIIDKSSPVQIGTKTWKKVYNFTTAIGNFATVVAIDDVDNLFAWGSNVSGNLGDNTTINKSSPVAVTTSGTGSWTQAFVGAATVAIQNNGTLWGWGNGAFIGDNTTISKSNPVQIGSSSWSMVGGALSSIAAIDSVGRLFTWGNQSVSGSGSLGTNDLINRSSPTLLAGAAGTFSWIFVSSGGANHIMAITNGGEMYGMGLNTQGQLGNNTVVNRSTATQVTGSTIWSKVSCGFSFTLASASDGSIWGWGNNDWGQATYNVTPTAANRSSPVLVISGSPAVLSTGQYNTALIYPNGLLFNWGYNLYGMLGDSSVVAKSSPIQIGNNADINTSLPVQIGTGSWSQVSAGNQYTLARDTNGILYAWGQDTTGQLGF